MKKQRATTGRLPLHTRCDAADPQDEVRVVHGHATQTCPAVTGSEFKQVVTLVGTGMERVTWGLAAHLEHLISQEGWWVHGWFILVLTGFFICLPIPFFKKGQKVSELVKGLTVGAA